MAALRSSSLDLPRPSAIFDPSLKFREKQRICLGPLASFKSCSVLRMKASTGPQGLTKEPLDKEEAKTEIANGCDLFDELKERFLSFKRNMYLKNSEHFENLAEIQKPKFMVIACADSRVCPSNVLGFKPGEAFTIRNVANLVPPFERGPSETNAALEFAVNTLEVENILVIGHSRCGGIRALMSMPDEDDSRSFIRSWVLIGKDARMNTRESASTLDFEQQCQHCEKASINHSLVSLLSYPWIEEKVRRGALLLHGGYYDFTNCTFEKWTLDYKAHSSDDDAGDRYAIKNREHWS